MICQRKHSLSKFMKGFWGDNSFWLYNLREVTDIMYCKNILAYTLYLDHTNVCVNACEWNVLYWTGPWHVHYDNTLQFNNHRNMHRRTPSFKYFSSHSHMGYTYTWVVLLTYTINSKYTDRIDRITDDTLYSIHIIYQRGRSQTWGLLEEVHILQLIHGLNPGSCIHCLGNSTDKTRWNRFPASISNNWQHTHTLFV